MPLNSVHVTRYGHHSLKPGAKGYYIKTESELSDDEYTYLFNAGPDRVSLPNVRITMARLFHSNSRTYCRNLMNRVMLKGRLAFVGNDTDSMHRFFKHGLGVKALPGGVFIYEFCSSSLKLTRCYIQTPLEGQLANIYGSQLFYLDSTHMTTKYLLRAMLPTSVDCFGLTCPLGVGLVGGEDLDSVTATLIALSLNHQGANCGTDRAPGWEEPLRLMLINQFFDTWHFSKDIETAKGGLGSDASIFTELMRNALFNDFGTKNAIDSHIHSILEKFPNNASKAHKLALELQRNCHKLCITYTAENFICSAKGAASRGEGAMSTWKGNGKIKDPMKRWNLLEFAQHHERRENSYVAKIKDLLGPLIKTNQPYSKFVLDKLNDAMGLSSEYKVSVLNKHLHHPDRKIDGHLYSVQRKGGKERHIHHVFSPHDTNLHMSCSCRKYKSFRIPDAHIARVHVEQDDGREFFSSSSVHPHWRLKKHPLYDSCLKDIEAATEIPMIPLNSETDSTAIVKVGTPTESISTTDVKLRLKTDILSMAAVRRVEIPRAENARYEVLHGFFETLVGYAKWDKVTYRRTYVQMRAMINNAKAEADKVSVEGMETVPMAPQRRGEGGKIECTDNLANRSKKLKLSKSKQLAQLGYPTCKVCQEHATKKQPGESNHRYGSKCPYWEAPVSKSKKSHKLQKDDLCQQVENVSDVECLGVLKNGIEKKHAIQLKELTLFGDTIHVPSDGNCGYWAIMRALEDNGSMGKTSVRDFRESIATFGCENESSFCGLQPLYLNSAGEPVVIFNPNIREKMGEVKDVGYFQREIINKIYQADIAYDGGVLSRVDQWMNVSRVFPLISMMYKVSLASFGGNASPGKRNTLIFEFDSATGNVVVHEYFGEYWVEPPHGTLCITGDDSMHFEYIRKHQ